MYTDHNKSTPSPVDKRVAIPGRLRRLFLSLLLGLGLAGLLPAALAPSPRVAYAQPHMLTNITGNVTTNTTWDLAGSPYVLQGNITINNGVTLTIEQGVVVQGDTDRFLRVFGHLNAVGTAGNPITFTSQTDSGPGEWDGLLFDGGTGILDHVIVRYGGSWSGVAASNIAVRGVNIGEVRIQNSQILSASRPANTDYGIYIDNANVIISNTLLANNGDDAATDKAVWVDAPEIHLVQFVNNTFTGNATDRVFVDQGTLAGSTTLHPETGLEGYELGGIVTVPGGITLTLQAGTIVMGYSSARLAVEGYLHAVGTSSQPITLTSSANTGPDEWQGLLFSGGTGVMEYVTVRYGGSWNSISRSNVAVRNVAAGQVYIENSALVYAGAAANPDYGLYIDNANVVLSNTLLANNGDDPAIDKAIWTDASELHMVQFTNNTFTNNASNRILIDVGILAAPLTIATQPGLEGYELDGDLTVPDGITLTAVADTTILGQAGSKLLVNGHLEAIGTPAQPITFTSSVRTGPGQWDGLHFEGGTGHLNYAVVRYAGAWNGTTRSNILVRSVLAGEVRIENSEIAYAGDPANPDYGLYIDNAPVVISNTHFMSNGDNPTDDKAIWVDSAELHLVQFNNNTFTNNASNRVLIDTGTLAAAITLGPQTGLEGYELDGILTVPGGLTLTLEADTTLMAQSNAYLYVSGHLQAVGTASQPITFTSSANTGPEEWRGIRIEGGTGALEYVTVRYGGVWNNSAASNIAIRNVNVGEVRIENSEILSAANVTLSDYGIYIDNANVIISNTLVANNGSHPIADKAIWTDAPDLEQVEFVNNTFANNASNRVLIDQGSLGGSVILKAHIGLEGYELDGILTVPNAMTLTIQADVSIMGQAASRLEVRGHLDAIGTPSQPISMTSSVNSAPGEWSGLRFEGGTGDLRYVSVRYGGMSDGVTFSNITIRNLNSGAIIMENCEVIGSSAWAMWIPADELHRLQLTNITFVNNAPNRIFVGSGVLANSLTLGPEPGLEGYEFSGVFQIPTGTTLTLDPGTMMMGQASARILVSGDLQALGTPSQPITLTSSTSTGPGDWVGLYFNGGTGHLRHTTVSYGGAWNNVSRSSILAQNVTAGEVRIEHSEIISSSEVGFPDYGIYIDNAKVVISNTLIANVGDDPVIDKAIWMDAGDMHQTLLVGNTFNANASSRVLVNGGALAGSAFLGTNVGLEGFELDGILQVPTGLTLTLDANTIILGRSNAYLFIEGGHIDALGTQSQPVILTSSSDTGPEEWGGVRFEGGTGHLRHTTVRYGGIWNILAFANLAIRDVTSGEVLLENSQIYGVATSSGNDYGIYAQNSNVTIRNTSVISNGSSASDAGIYATVSHIVLENSVVSDNAGTGFLLVNGAGDITCSSVIDNQGDGIAITGASTNFTALSAYIFGNTGLGLNNQTPDLADARFTWWGAADGPGGVGPGSGDEISANVVYAPWLPAPSCVTNLNITKTVSHDPIAAGMLLTYTLTVENSGPGDATGVVVTDTLPADAIYDSSSTSQGPGCSPSGNEVVCDLGTVADDASATATITVMVDPSARGIFTNTATVQSNETDYAQNNNQDDIPSEATGVTGLALTKQGNPDPVMAGSMLTYTLLVTNTGPSTAFNVVLTDTLPAGVLLDDAASSAGVCNPLGGEILCSLNDVFPGTGVNITITVIVDALTRGTVPNTATIAAAEPDFDTSDNTITITTAVDALIDMWVDKTASPDPAVAGETLVYQLTMANDGPSVATNVTLTDTLPAELTVDGFSFSAGNCTLQSDTLTCDMGIVYPASLITVTITTTVDAALRGDLTNVAAVSALETEQDINNNSVTLVTNISAEVDLSVAKFAAPSPVLAGETLTYALTAANSGPSAATSVLLSDMLPTGITVDGFETSQGDCNLASGTLTCSLGALLPGASAQVTVTATVAPSSRGELENTAAITAAETELNPDDNTVTVTTPVDAEVDLQVSGAAIPNLVTVGDALTYTFAITNHGPADALGVTLTDTLPVGITVDGFAVSQGSCGLAGSLLVCDLGALSPGAVATVAITATVDPAAGDTLENIAVAASAETERTPDDNSVTLLTTVDAEVDLWVTQTAAPDPVTTGTALTYTIVVTNNGPAPATGVVLTETLPAGFAAPSQGSCNLVEAALVCDLGGLYPTDSVTLTITGVVDFSVTGALTSTAVVSANELETSPASNTAVLAVNTVPGLRFIFLPVVIR